MLLHTHAGLLSSHFKLKLARQHSLFITQTDVLVYSVFNTLPQEGRELLQPLPLQIYLVPLLYFG